MTVETTRAGDTRDGEQVDEIAMKVPAAVATTDALKQLEKAAKRLAKRHGVDPN